MVQASIYDVAGNVTIADPIEVIVGKIDDIVNIDDGAVSYSPKTWTNEFTQKLQILFLFQS